MPQTTKDNADDVLNLYCTQQDTGETLLVKTKEEEDVLNLYWRQQATKCVKPVLLISCSKRTHLQNILKVDTSETIYIQKLRRLDSRKNKQ